VKPNEDSTACPTPPASELPTPVVEARGIGKWYGPRAVLTDVNLTIRPGKVTCVIGPSGAGKTTLLRCIDLLTLIDHGEIFFKGAPVISATARTRNGIDGGGIIELLLRGKVSPVVVERQISMQPHKYRQRVGMIFQDFNLWPTRSVRENLLLAPVHVDHANAAAAEERARQVLERVGLPGVLDRFPHQLSGGQRQRIAIARALMMDCELLAADELTSALDPELIAEVLTVLRELAKGGTSMVIVTHHLEFAKDIADEIVMLDEGRVIEAGSADQVFGAPAEERTRRFVSALAAAG
jgi:polar amino acid transport system ATP-binding protein